MIKVVFSGIGSTESYKERTYASVQEAQAANWAPIGTGFGHPLYKQAKISGYAADGRNSVEILRA